MTGIRVPNRQWMQINTIEKSKIVGTFFFVLFTIYLDSNMPSQNKKIQKIKTELKDEKKQIRGWSLGVAPQRSVRSEPGSELGHLLVGVGLALFLLHTELLGLQLHQLVPGSCQLLLKGASPSSCPCER